jgi:hypothetical protein
VTLRERFHVELQAHKGLFDSLRRELRTKSFIALWGQSVVLLGGNRWMLVDDASGELPGDGALVLRLTSHLDTLSTGFALPSPAADRGQFDLFPVQSVSVPIVDKARRRRPATVPGRRRSA